MVIIAVTQKKEKYMGHLVIETPEKGQQVLDDLGRKLKKRIGASPLGLCPVDMLLNYLRICHAQSWKKPMNLFNASQTAT